MDNRTLKDFMRDHHCLVEDLRIAANRLQLAEGETILSNSLRKCADELAEYDIFYCKEYISPFGDDEEGREGE